MPGRLVPLVSGEIYHLYNRGVKKQDIFLTTRDYRRFQQTLYYYQYLKPKPRFSLLTKSSLTSFNPPTENKLVDIFCYCLMPNHFHLLVKQIKDNGISIFISQLTNSYTKYFNSKHGFVGPALQGTFKAVLVENDEQFLHLSRYIHLNPTVSGIIKDPFRYLWSSLSEYINDAPLFCSTHDLLSFFTSPNKYFDFVKDQIDYGTSLEIIKHKLLEDF